MKGQTLTERLVRVEEKTDCILIKLQNHLVHHETMERMWIKITVSTIIALFLFTIKMGYTLFVDYILPHC